MTRSVGLNGLAVLPARPPPCRDVAVVTGGVGRARYTAARDTPNPSPDSAMDFPPARDARACRTYAAITFGGRPVFRPRARAARADLLGPPAYRQGQQLLAEIEQANASGLNSPRAVTTADRSRPPGSAVARACPP